MRRCILALGAVAVAAAGEYGSEGTAASSKKTTKSSKAHLTTEGAIGFLSDSVFLTRDLTFFIGSSAFHLVWDNLPPKMRSDGLAMYDSLEDQFTTVRMQNGVPSYTQIRSDIVSLYDQKLKPQFSMIYNLADKVASPVMKLVLPMKEKFEQAYPSQKGKLPNHIIDLGLVLFFLVYYVLTYCMGLACCVLCCGCCKSRKPKQPELKKKPQPVPTGKKKN